MTKSLVTELSTTYKTDLPDVVLQEAHARGVVALDIETSGLSWDRDKIATCQVFVPNFEVSIVQFGAGANRPPNLCLLLEDPFLNKIFHHAMFDLRFMVFHWDLRPDNVTCTKIASKLLEPLEQDHSLQRILQRYLNVQIDKDSRVSNWLKDDLSKEQLEYAASDVVYLPQLFGFLKEQLTLGNRWDLAKRSFEFLPTRVRLDILGAGDVFSY